MHCIAFAVLSILLVPGLSGAALVEPGPNGKLSYQSHKLPGSDSDRGDIVPDFSWCGYRSQAAPIPVVPVVLRITAQPGDNRAALQAAIDKLSQMPLDASGIRGALFLEAGEYRISGTLQVKASGVVLRGAGDGADGTRLIATQKGQHTLVQFSGSGGPVETGNRSAVVDAYVPIGTRTIQVAAGHGFKAGDAVLVRRTPNQAWIAMLGMSQYGWSAGGYALAYKRNIMEVSGNSLTLDAPMVDPVDAKFADATVSRYSWPGRIENCGIESMRLISEFQGEDDENHGWHAVGFDQIQDAWMRRVEAQHFGYSAANVGTGGYRISILDSKNIDPKSQTTGGRKYSFNVTGQLVLVMGCHARNGRHDFVTGARVPGPNAFVRCTAELQKADMGPHHRWSTGILFDNITGDGALNVQNRAASGTGHGWAGAQCLFWNCKVKSMVVQSPPGHVNWAIGNLATVTGKGGWYTGDAAYVEATAPLGAPVSIFDQQLSDRGLGANNPGITAIRFPTQSGMRGNGYGIRPLGDDRWELSLPSDGLFSLAVLDLAGRLETVRSPAWGGRGTQVLRLSKRGLRAGRRLVVLDAQGLPAFLH